MTNARCPDHPLAVVQAGHCAACLLENALSGALEDESAGAPRLTIQTPFGGTGAASVFLVRAGEPYGRLLRLKTWRRPAPPGFLRGFTQLRRRMNAWGPAEVDVPLAAVVDDLGVASVLSEFRRGVPILSLVAAGRLSPDRAIAWLEKLRQATLQAHRLGLVHGSVRPGNVIATADAASAWLLDFGLAPLLDGSGTAADAAADITGFDILIAAVASVTFPASS